LDNSKPPLRAVLYVRLSVDVEGSTSIARQTADLEALAAREGWTVARILTDNSISGRKVRANAKTALRMLREGEAEVLAVWKLDRWTRQGIGAIGELVDTLDAAPGARFVALQDGLRSDQSSWRLIASVLAEVARTEAENTALRVRSAITDGKKRLRFTGGTVGLGYRTTEHPSGEGRALVLDDVEAALVREIAERALSGETVSSIARSLNGRNEPTPRSEARRARQAGEPQAGLDTGTWTTNRIQALLTSEHILGRITSNGELIRDPDGLPVAAWPPVIDATLAGRLRAVVRDPRQKPGHVPAAPRRRAARLLSGLAYCAHCEGKMHVNTTGARPIYACVGSIVRGCASPTMTAELAERFVESHFLKLVGEVQEFEYVQTAADNGTAAQLVEVEQALQTATGELLRDDVDTAEVLARLASLKALRGELRSIPTLAAGEYRLTGKTIAEAWADRDMPGRRAMLKSRIDSVSIASLKPGAARKTFDPSRITFNWNPEAA
jgi:site-specific DNA recombinase